MKDDLSYWLWLSEVEGVGPKTFFHLVKIFGSARKVWEASPKEFGAKRVENRVKDAIFSAKEKVDPKGLLQSLVKKNIQFLPFFDKNYPANLKKIYDPPPILYFKGNFCEEDRLAVAVVGSRKMSAYGREVTEYLVEGLVNAGITIVSGLARGIDGWAHRTAIEAGGRTIAVLGSGVDVIYPPEHQNLSEQIIKGRGAVVSEFPPGTGATPGNFPARNRLISGLSLGVLVTEVAQDSGSLITASYALEQNREVFAVPGPITSPLSRGPLDLVKSGAKLVSQVFDILEELQIEARFQKLEARKILPESREEELLLQVFGSEQKHIDEIVRQSGLSTAKVMATLSVMELSGKVKQVGNGVYAKVGNW